jgi:hypothetical protein
MHSGDVALRFSIVFAVAGFITMAAVFTRLTDVKRVVLKQ